MNDELFHKQFKKALGKTPSHFNYLIEDLIDRMDKIEQTLKQQSKVTSASLIKSEAIADILEEASLIQDKEIIRRVKEIAESLENKKLIE